MAYNLTATWCKSNTNAAPDALPCYPALEPNQEDMIAECNEDHSPAHQLQNLEYSKVMTNQRV